MEAFSPINIVLLYLIWGIFIALGGVGVGNGSSRGEQIVAGGGVNTQGGMPFSNTKGVFPSLPPEYAFGYKFMCDKCFVFLSANAAITNKQSSNVVVIQFSVIFLYSFICF